MPSSIRFFGRFIVAIAALGASSALPSPAAQLEHAPPALTAGQRNAPMVIKVVRDGRPDCGSACTEWIAMEGRIVQGTARDFDRVLRGLHGRKLPIFIDSGGGAVRDAMAVGRAIRSHHLDVAVAETVGCPDCGRGAALPQEIKAVCASACVLVLAAGEHRIVPPTVAIGVHQMTLTQTQILVKRTFRVFYRSFGGRRREVGRTLISARPVAIRTRSGPSSDSTNREVAQYLETMGIGPQLMPLMLATPRESVRWLNADEMRESALMTTQRNGATLLAKADAKGAVPETPAVADDAKLVVGSRTEAETGTVSWRLDRGEGRHVAIVADVTIPARKLTLSLRILPASNAAAAPLVVEVVEGGPSEAAPPLAHRVDRIFPLEARAATKFLDAMAGATPLTGDAQIIDAGTAHGTGWRLVPRPKATIVGPGAPARIGMGLVIDGDRADLSFADGAAALPLYREAASDWAVEVAGKPPAPAPARGPLIRVSAP